MERLASFAPGTLAQFSKTNTVSKGITVGPSHASPELVALYLSNVPIRPKIVPPGTFDEQDHQKIAPCLTKKQWKALSAKIWKVVG
jgi:hypothetical protein